MSNTINIKNKKAYFDYELLEKMVAGIQLTGTEIKSVRMGKVSIADAWCIFDKSELWIRSMNIAEYKMGSHYNHDPGRVRKLLLNRKELDKLDKKVKEKGLTIVVLRVFINNNNLAKVEIALAKGKQSHDKRETLKRKDAKREMDRVMKREY